ncbi:MAG: UDP-N-acetylenolpyruvoylglucosamine reductase [Candidatus Marinimicrobia bacterium]|nr:UDP-N-acetylenolpyruvoylglucosamine reductase [Candidatus Neomarinimicrobiota bacterium]|tara:strand:- start:1659 stop:2570 length:912 start_codon:yes stop_codon:yes gene_type:complete
MKQKVKLLKILKKNKYNFLNNESMKKHTTFGIGGIAEIIIFPNDEVEIIELMKLIKKYNIKYYLLGSGSNVLISDEKISGIIISLKKSLKTIEFDNDNVTVGSGVMLGTLVKQLNSRNITGYEGLVGVPGTVGGALIMNAGAFGAEISNNFISAKTVNENGEIKNYDKEQISFSYRKSSFPKNEILIKSTFKCIKGSPEKINIKKTKTSKDRKDKQPLTYRSAGSVFKNPKGEFSAGYLIDKTGLKGKKIGNAQISEKHANFIINLGDAKSKDVMQLIKIIKIEVYNKFKINLELEIKLIGIS